MSIPATDNMYYVCSIFKSIQVEPGKPGSEVSKGKRTISQRKTWPIESFVTTLIEPFSDDWNKVGICWLGHSTQLHATARSR